MLSPALGSLIAALVRYCKLAVTDHQCLNGRALPYLSEHCIPVSSADTRRVLRSASRHLLAVPRFRLNTYGRRAFSVAGPMAWNSLPDFIRHPMSSTNCFRRLLTWWLGSRVVSVEDSGAGGPGFKSQSRRCRVTVLGKLFTPVVPLFTKQRNW